MTCARARSRPNIEKIPQPSETLNSQIHPTGIRDAKLSLPAGARVCVCVPILRAFTRTKLSLHYYRRWETIGYQRRLASSMTSKLYVVTYIPLTFQKGAPPLPLALSLRRRWNSRRNEISGKRALSAGTRIRRYQRRKSAKGGKIRRRQRTPVGV